TLDAVNNIQNTGATIKADEKLDIKAKNIKIDTLEESRYYNDGSADNYTTIDNKSNIASNIEAKNINMEAKKDIDIKGSNMVAKNEANIKADGDVNIVSATDSRFYAHKETNKGKFGKSSSEESIAYATRNVASNIIGDKVNITSGKDVSLLGSNVQANTEGQIKADGNITQAGVKDINYSYHKKTKTGFMGLTSKSVTDENYAEKAILSATLAGDKGLTYDSKKNLILSGVKVVSSGNINLKGKDVEINPLATKSYNKHEEVKKDFSGSFSPKGISVSYGKDKLDSKTDIVNQTASQIVSNKDINIEATNKVKAKSVDIYAKND
ncbi:hemagglutinin repeat-containing protein, partial [Fusobacterium polymorphum]|uniref:hemagglutinin repeat-containing protein n=1 Tax=Fusobacterium nucleatum subsp. polymorphum TaxID=76857 RepID=UPI0030085DF2